MYRVSDPTPHWHYIGTGLGSAFNFELTFRLYDEQAMNSDNEPPTWPASLMKNLADYVDRTGNWFAPLHSMTCNGPIVVGLPTDLDAVAFISDPQLDPIDSLSGEIEFVQIVGITADELEAWTNWQARGMVDLLLQRYPWGITQIERSSMLTDPAVAEQIQSGIARDGSSIGAFAIENLSWTSGSPVTVRIGANQVQSFIQLLSGRLSFGQDLVLFGPEGRSIQMFATAAGDDNQVIISQSTMTVRLTSSTIEALVAALKPEQGLYSVSPLNEQLIFEVVPSEILDADGKVTRIVG
ncbi:MAG: suppressor of fused domain protein [Propionibacteriaceae bacterium]